jgi:thiopurine S-methyltransferase
MDKTYWLNRWEAGDIHFNQPTPHRFLTKHFKTLDLQPQEQVFVPLCGKSIDMTWLMQQKQRVIGVEISPIAIADFLKENNMDTIQRAEGPFQLYQNASCTLYNGDLFHLSSKHLAEIKAVYDRGCLTAFPPQTLRNQYIDWIKATIPLHCKILLVVLQHGATNIQSPPFSTSFEEVNLCFNSHFSVTQLEKEFITEIPPHWAEKGLHDVYECAYLLQKVL